MERMTALHPASLTVVAPSASFTATWSRLRPLSRYALFALVSFVVVLVGVLVRLEVQQLEIDLDRNDRAQRAASVLQERLELELRSRRRLHAVQSFAGQLQARPDAMIVRVEGRP
jgi:hypothetical protein